MITRHYLSIRTAGGGKRRVHYRRCGAGPVLLMVHQSPRSSAEYETLMRQWGEGFTCIAPDTPGFGQSDPLPGDPEIDAYADALAEFIAALGLSNIAAYGFHSGGIILVTALKRNPELFSGLAVGGYAVWSPEEMALFGESYLPEFRPSSYGEHLTWLWNRILEQSWFFPWFDTREEARLSVANAMPDRVHAVVMEMLDAGNAYRAGYGAVLHAPRDIPAANSNVPPCLITAYDGDPLQPHIDRLGKMPLGWSAHKVATPQAHEEASFSFLKKLPAISLDTIPEDDDAGFVYVTTDKFDGLIHWRGNAESGKITLHAPGKAAELEDAQNSIAIDLPGHGLSDGWKDGAPLDWQDWQNVLDAAALNLNCANIVRPKIPLGDPDRLYPDLTPDRFGQYLTTAWQIVRARHLFSPWYAVDASNAISFDPNSLLPEKLALEHRALIRAKSAKAYHIALSKAG